MYVACIVPHDSVKSLTLWRKVGIECLPKIGPLRIIAFWPFLTRRCCVSFAAVLLAAWDPIETEHLRLAPPVLDLVVSVIAPLLVLSRHRQAPSVQRNLSV